jgi:hypothetical protein
VIASSCCLIRSHLASNPVQHSSLKGRSHYPRKKGPAFTTLRRRLASSLLGHLPITICRLEDYNSSARIAHWQTFAQVRQGASRLFGWCFYKSGVPFALRYDCCLIVTLGSRLFHAGHLQAP